MSTELVRDLFHSLETTLHDRLKVITELLVRSSTTERGSGQVDTAGIERLNSIVADMKKALDELIPAHDRLKIRVEMLETSVYPFVDRFANMNLLVRDQESSLEDMKKRLSALEVKADTEKPVEAAEAEAEEEAAVQAEVEVLEEVVEEEEEETEEVELEPFEYKGRTYARDASNQVYAVDDEGNANDEVIGIWNPKTQRIVRVSPNA
jgi:hypothetical protein